MKPAAKGRVPSLRQLRVGEEIRHCLAGVLARDDLRDPALRGRVITVSEVRVSPDLRNATVFVMPLGGDDVTEVMDALGRAAAFLRGQVSRQIRLKFSPRLSFQYDSVFDEAARVDGLLRSPAVARDLKADPVDGDGNGET
jgi:ribosome-binding factor A